MGFSKNRSFIPATNRALPNGVEAAVYSDAPRNAACSARCSERTDAITCFVDGAGLVMNRILSDGL